jgi:hypothetical protein
MKYFPVSHGSDEWFQCRVGIPTASCFDKIITPNGKISQAKAGEFYSGSDIPKFSQTAESYAHLLLAEIITNQAWSKFPPSYWMERGALMEQEAAQLYEFETGYILDRGGFMTDDLCRWGASPDRRILDADGNVIGALEIKCPAPWTHVENLLKKEIDKDYIPQVQGQMFCGDLQFVDWFSYYPGMPPSLITTKRDEYFIESLEEGLLRFDAMLTIKKQQLVEIGALDKMPVKVMPDLFDGIEALLEGEFETTIMAG